jgi:hypothetical protein
MKIVASLLGFCTGIALTYLIIRPGIETSQGTEPVSPNPRPHGNPTLGVTTEFGR